MGRLVAELIFEIDPKPVLIEKKRAGAGHDNCPVDGDIDAGRDERSVGQRIPPVDPERGQYSSAKPQRCLRGI